MLNSIFSCFLDIAL